MLPRNVLLILASPADSFGAALADAYADSAEHAGHRVERLALDTLDFDPLLHHGYRREQALEADLQAARQALLRADHLVFVYPVWWGSVPALLKGFLDRLLLPGFAFRYRPGQAMPERLLGGRSAQLLVTMDSPPWYFRWVTGAPAIAQMKRATLEFCGIRPVAVACFGPLQDSTPARRERWLAEARALGAVLPPARR
ncbi:NAD(P)H-dependent oxidoreductase [Geopseudomonas guangdongensis]|uniref:NAD(P)H dehydrogenase (Quinone) n=1 Tax=Geopseudomonas guangdongensis TaxID=1245526 RepID=A0A1H2HJ10_9GAMM|nr:NAD(P)H-dependent oxidoreductase [Pseudomonas guangdongensis]SDU31729.1 NAD(P)H dehydrogenase (quinone) [Pseudomonas guangdongensis]